jgi:hypothetical protein
MCIVFFSSSSGIQVYTNSKLYGVQAFYRSAGVQ